MPSFVLMGWCILTENLTLNYCVYDSCMDRGIPLPKRKYNSGDSLMERITGAGDLYLSSETRLSFASGDENCAYRFFIILFLPLFPIEPCKEPVRGRDTDGDAYIYCFKCSWRWQEVVYIYLRNWSVFFMVLLTIMFLS